MLSVCWIVQALRASLAAVKTNVGHIEGGAGITGPDQGLHAAADHTGMREVMWHMLLSVFFGCASGEPTILLKRKACSNSCQQATHLQRDREGRHTQLATKIAVDGLPQSEWMGFCGVRMKERERESVGHTWRSGMTA